MMMYGLCPNTGKCCSSIESGGQGTTTLEQSNIRMTNIEVKFFRNSFTTANASWKRGDRVTAQAQTLSAHSGECFAFVTRPYIKIKLYLSNHLTGLNTALPFIRSICSGIT